MTAKAILTAYLRKANAIINAALESMSDTRNITNIENGDEKLLFMNNVYDANELDSKWIYGRVNLFGTSLYYAQNGDTKPSSSVNEEAITKIRMAKAYLWLHTIPFDYAKLISSASYFRKGAQTTGGIEAMPYLYLVFLGSLLWRREYWTINNQDPIKMPNKYKNSRYTKDKSLLFSTSSGYKLVFQSSSGGMTPVDINTFISNNIDSHVIKALTTMFTEFVGTNWSTIENMFELIVVDKTTGTPRPVYLDDFTNMASAAKKYLDGKCFELNSICFNQGLEISGGKFIMNNTVFGMIMPYDDSNVMLAPFKTDAIMNAINEIYRMPAYVLTTGFVTTGQNTVNNVPQNFAKSYIAQFTNTLDTLSTRAVAYEKAGYPVDEKTKQLRDFHIAIYMYFKNVWDKWLNGYFNSDETIHLNTKSYLIRDSFKVENYFSHFMFMDSFYRNIFKKLKLNCGTLLEHYTNRTNNYNMFSYLGAVASSHQCMFLSIPDYIDLGNDDDTIAEQNLADLFKPMPANSIPPPQMENRFIVMYTHQPSSVTTVDKSDFRVDSFDIWSEDDGQNVKPMKVFAHGCKGNADDGGDGLDQINRYGYNVPSFGVAYSRQTNSIFKSIKASMENPVMTEQAVLAMGAIAELGNSTKKMVCFYGQDIYPIYSNYSYIIEVEMMGNAQIQPLMYFQLMNIPMYRGTYMIISVTHTMSQGDMTTTIKATKMSKYATPFVSNWFTLPPEDQGTVNGPSSEYSSQLTAMDGTVMNVTDCKFATAVKNLIGTPYYWGNTNGGLDCAGFTRKVYADAYNVDIPFGTTYQLNTFKKMADNGTATLVETHIDKEKGNYDEFAKKAVCGDILFIGYQTETSISHVALYMGCTNGKYYIAESSGGKERHEPGVVCRDADHSSLLTASKSKGRYEIKYIGHWNHTPDNSGCSPVNGGTSDTFTGTLATVKISSQEQQNNGYKIMDSLINTGFTLNNKTVKLTPMQAAAIAGVWFQESGWNPLAVGSAGDYGVAQWLGERKYGNYKIYCKEKGVTNGNDATAMKTLDEQLAYAKWEFNRPFFKDLCHLWGNDANYRNKYGWKCGNMMIYENDMQYSDAKLYDLVYRFMVGYENLKAPEHGKFFAIENRAKYAKSAYDLYMNGRVTGGSLVNYPPQRRVST